MSIPRPLPPIPNDDSAQELYRWIDEIPLSRAKKNINRDFSDGVLVAEVIQHSIPGLVEIHNYVSSSSLNQKMHNWNTLNLKVFKKLGFGVNNRDMEDCANMVSGAIEKVLYRLQGQLERAKSRGMPDTPSSRPSHRGSATPTRSMTTKGEPIPYSLEQLTRVLQDQDTIIAELRRTSDILNQKVDKLEQLVEIKDKKIEALLQQARTGKPLKS